MLATTNLYEICVGILPLASRHTLHITKAQIASVDSSEALNLNSYHKQLSLSLIRNREEDGLKIEIYYPDKSYFNLYGKSTINVRYTAGENYLVTFFTNPVRSLCKLLIIKSLTDSPVVCTLTKAI